MEIIGIKHKGLKDYYTKGKGGKIDPSHLERINDIFSIFESAQKLSDIQAFPSLRCHELKKPPLRGHYAVNVSGAWRITFKVNNQNQLELIDYMQYH